MWKEIVICSLHSVLCLVVFAKCKGRLMNENIIVFNWTGKIKMYEQ